MGCDIRYCDEIIGSIPAWRIVTFPPNRTFVYPDLKHADAARIIARAWFNHEQKCGQKFGWSAFARELDYMRRQSRTRRVRGISGAVSDKLYGNITRGTLPRNERVRNLLIEWAGWPWK